MRVVLIENLYPGMELAEPLYTEDHSIVPILLKGTVLSENMIRRLKEHGIAEVRIVSEEARGCKTIFP